MFQTFLTTIYYSNTGRDYLMVLVIFIGVLIVLKIFKMIIIARLKKLAERTKNDIDDALIKVISNIKWPFYFLLSFYLAIYRLTLPDLAFKIVKILFLIILIYEIIRAIQQIIEYTARRAMAKRGDEDDTAIKTLSVIVKIILWSLGLVLVLGNLGVNVTSLIAGLGIGGIAVALAIQNILGDIFASFSILIDKPFQVGDFIKAGDDMGTVEKIGIKTTRIKTLLGEELIISNKELTSSRVQNFKRMEKRRVIFELGVIYETPKEKLEKIPEIVKEVIVDTKKTEFDRCHFSKYGDFSLIFENVYYVLSSDYNQYMDIHQDINLKIFEVFKKHGIEFAYPTSVEYQKKI